MRKYLNSSGLLQSLLFVFLTVSGVSTSPVEASLAPGYDMTAALRGADLIIRGNVVEVRSQWVEDANGANIYTFVQMEVVETVKGNIYGERLEFRVMGYRRGDNAIGK